MMELSEVSLEFIECANWKKWKKVFESKGSSWMDGLVKSWIEYCNNNRNCYQTFLTFDYNVCSRTISSEWTIIFGQQNWEVLFDFKSTIHYIVCSDVKNNIPWEQSLGVKGCEILDIFIGSCFHPIWSHSPSIENIVKNIGRAYL